MISNCLRIFILVLAALIPGFGKPKVVCTINIIADMAKQVAGSDFEVISLLPLGADPHIYEPTTADARKIADADLIFRNGLTLEGWLDKLIASSGTKARIYTLTDGIEPIVNPGYHNAADPHTWMSVRLGAQYVRNIEKAFLENTSSSAAIQTNAKNYLRQLTETDQIIQNLIAKIPAAQRVIITSHDAFRYYSKDYGFEVASVLGTSTDAEVGIKEINQLISIIKQKGIKAIFVESTINPKLLEQVAQDQGIQIGGKLFADSMGDSLSGADSYTKMLIHNTKVIVAGLGQPATKSGGNQPDFNLIATTLVVFLLVFYALFKKVHPRQNYVANSKIKLLEIKDLSVSLGEKSILTNIFLKLTPGKIYGLIGANGSGKSTLLKAVLGLLPVESGSVSYGNQELASIRKSVAYLAQKDQMDHSFPATVYDLVSIGLFPHKSVFEGFGNEDKKRIEHFLHLLEILSLKDNQISELSGGQFQRALIARALCQDADIYFLDEPFVGVDMASEEKIMAILRDLAAKGKLVLIVHHDLAKVGEYFDDVIMINQRLVAYGPVKEVFTEENIQKTYSGRLTLLQKALKSAIG